jgi:Flp pilus assembly protein TadB
MKLFDYILLALCIVAFIIGVVETIATGLAGSYFLLMISLVLLFWFQLRKQKRKEKEKG